MRVNYPGYFEKNELGGYSVWFPDLPECHTDGDDLDDAANMAAEALELVIESYLDNGRELPAPSLEATCPKGARELLVSVEVNVENRLVTTREAAKLLGVSDARVRQLILGGSLLARKQAGANLVHLRSVLDRMRERPTGGRPRTVTL